MGCCVSSNRSSISASSPTKDKDFEPPRSNISRVKKASESRTPPPLPVEEETVKEVLSETPRWKPTVAKFDKFEGKNEVEKPLAFINKAEEISEVSEVCSLSESVSTTTVTDKREEEEEMRQWVNRSPANMEKNRSFTGGGRERTVGKSPAKRSEQSPGRRNVGSARVVQSRDQISNGGTRNHPRRRDAGENSGRRSRSPATRTDEGATRSIVGRSPSARRTSKSPARVRTAAPESGGRKMENSSMESKWPSSANESLENPLVSLECFIFL
ncbi:uncharacterized protein LOC133306715 [Gastrolobium bilobum]|uniref:uncharacterized protein LOC133306715 n=1 Tax=Gastrolobium bilobum TaxID=150636 RepID=UPI002AB25D2D|nr:uncharacterized protein LOC133306715 [Gastrolobium bilobum]